MPDVLSSHKMTDATPGLSPSGNGLRPLRFIRRLQRHIEDGVEYSFRRTGQTQ